jgi:hypothetical protein
MPGAKGRRKAETLVRLVPSCQTTSLAGGTRARSESGPGRGGQVQSLALGEERRGRARTRTHLFVWPPAASHA